jgi:hypothetical protein
MQVNSKPRQMWPEDLVQMPLTGATVIRIANGFLDRFMATKNFVLYGWTSYITKRRLNPHRFIGKNPIIGWTPQLKICMPIAQPSRRARKGRGN